MRVPRAGVLFVDSVLEERCQTARRRFGREAV